RAGRDYARLRTRRVAGALQLFTGGFAARVRDRQRAFVAVRDRARVLAAGAFEAAFDAFRQRVIQVDGDVTDRALELGGLDKRRAFVLAFAFGVHFATSLVAVFAGVGLAALLDLRARDVFRRRGRSAAHRYCAEREHRQDADPHGADASHTSSFALRISLRGRDDHACLGRAALPAAPAPRQPHDVVAATVPDRH